MAALLPWKEFPTRLSPKLGDGVLDRPWEQVGTVHSLRTTECHVIERSEGFLPVLCPARLVYFCHFLGDRKAGSATPGGISTAPPLPTGSSWVGDPPPVPHGVYIWHREDSSKAGHRSHRSLIALSGPDVHLIEMYSLVFVYHSRLLWFIPAKSYPMYLNNGQIIPLYGARTRFSAWIIRLLSWLPGRLIIWAFNSESTAQK